MFSANASLAISSSVIAYTSAQATTLGVSMSGCSTLTHKGVAGGEPCNVRARLDQPFAGHGRPHQTGFPECVDGYGCVDPFARMFVVQPEVPTVRAVPEDDAAWREQARGTLYSETIMRAMVKDLSRFSAAATCAY